MSRGARTARLLLAVAVALPGLVVATAASAQTTPPVAPAVVEGDGAARPGRGDVVRQRPVVVSAEALRPAGRSQVTLDLFTDVEVVAEVAPSPSGADGWRAWSGTVAGDAASSVVVSTDGTTTSALVVTDGATYRVRSDGTGGQVAQEVTPAEPEGDDSVVPPPGPVPAARPAPPTAADGDAPPAVADVGDPVVDVLVAYTPGALANAGSGPEPGAGGNLAALQAEVALAVTLSNTAFGTSEVAGRFRLAGTYALTEDITCSSEDLRLVRESGDGVADGVHARRDQVGADAVVVLTEVGCGIGYRPITTGQLVAQYMVSVVGYSWAATNLTFAHELGHNLGLHHDRYQVSVGGENTQVLYAHGYGYVDVAARFRTVMAYDRRCQDAGTSCPRLVRFSHPWLTYAGAPTGRPQGTAEAADAHAALEGAFPTVAGLRVGPAPFTTWDRFVQQQARDLRFGATAPAAEVSVLRGSLARRELTPEAHVETLLRGEYAAVVAPVTRLYQAYYLRLPDTDGLAYWVGRFRGGLSVNKMSQYFSGTPEFRGRYGTLTDRQFVELVYRNVLGRTGEADGVAFWTGELDRGVRNRGTVMVGFSESAEHEARTAATVDAVLVTSGLLARVPTPAERDAFAALRAAGTPVQQVVRELLATPEYGARIIP